MVTDCRVLIRRHPDHTPRPARITNEVWLIERDER